MKTQFDPKNNIVKLCMMGIGMRDSGKLEESGILFLKAWSEATNDFERFIAAYFVAQYQNNVSDKLKWFETSLQFALKLNDDSIKSAFTSLYLSIAKCYEALSNPVKANLKVGDRLTAGEESNYKPELKMNHIYFTSLVNGAGLAAELAKGEGSPRSYIIEPTGQFENDPNVTDKKFPGNLSCSQYHLFEDGIFLWPNFTKRLKRLIFQTCHHSFMTNSMVFCL